MPLSLAYQFKCHILNPWLIRMKPFPPYPLLAFSQFHLSFLYSLWCCICFGDDFFAFPFLYWTLLMPIAFPLIVVPCGFWSPVDEIFVSFSWVMTVYLAIYFICSVDSFFFVERFYQQGFYLLLFLLFLSSFSRSICASTMQVYFIYCSSWNTLLSGSPIWYTSIDSR